MPSISFGVPVLESIRPTTKLVCDAHLMVTEPIRYVEAFAKAGADLITVHLEACEDINATIEKIRACGCKVGVSICPDTPVISVKKSAEESRHDSDHVCTSRVWRSGIYSGIIG